MIIDRASFFIMFCAFKKFKTLKYVSYLTSLIFNDQKIQFCSLLNDSSLATPYLNKSFFIIWVVHLVHLRTNSVIVILYSNVSNKRTVFKITVRGDRISKKNKRTVWKNPSISVQVSFFSENIIILWFYCFFMIFSLDNWQFITGNFVGFKKIKFLQNYDNFLRSLMSKIDKRTGLQSLQGGFFKEKK